MSQDMRDPRMPPPKTDAERYAHWVGLRYGWKVRDNLNLPDEEYTTIKAVAKEVLAPLEFEYWLGDTVKETNDLREELGLLDELGPYSESE